MKTSSKRVSAFSDVRNCSLAAVIFVCLLLSASLVSAAPPPVVWQDIIREDFEGSFPQTGWFVAGNDPNWDVTAYDAHGGTWSAWCGASALSPASGYANNMYAWLLYGPFSLADAVDANITFWYKDDSEPNHDAFGCYVSTNLLYFYGFTTNGILDTWRSETISLTNIPCLGNVCGQPQVAIAFVFESNGSIAGPAFKGAFIDDIVIRKAVLPPCILCDDPSLGFRSNCFGFNITGGAGQTIVVQRSTNLISWTALATNTVGTAPWYFSDTACTNCSRCFYRLVSQPCP